MASFSLESISTEKFTAAHLITFNRVKALFDEGKSLHSSYFSCPEDPEPVEFRLHLTFSVGNVLKCFLSSKTRAITARHMRFTLLDSNGLTLRYMPFTGFKAEQNTQMGADIFYIAKELKEDVTWRLKCEVDYDGIPSNADFDLIKAHDPNTPQQMLKLLEDAEDADVNFIVGTETIKAHKLILVARSTYFQNMFRSGMEESRSNKVQVPNASPDIVKEMLKFIYSGAAPKNILDIGTQLLPLADQYGLDELKKMCESAVGSRISVDNVIEVLLLADLHNCPKLTKRCIPLFKANVASLKQSASWAKLKANPFLIVSLLENCF